MNNKLSSDILINKDVVVIDDDPNSLDVAVILLEFAGANVHQAVNGQQGLDVIRDIKPVLVISDISMPVLDGWQLIQLIRKDQNLKDLLVLALTAHAMKGDRERVLTAGFNGYLTKPLQPDTFITHLLKVIESANNLHTTTFNLILE